MNPDTQSAASDVPLVPARSALRGETCVPLAAAAVHGVRRISPEEAARIAFELHGLRAAIEPLTGEADENFRLSSPQGEFILKIASPAEDPAVVDLSAAALIHIARADPRFPCPRVCRDRDGRVVTAVKDAAGRDRLVRLLTWLPGQMMQSAPRSKALRVACGTLAARLALALRGFRHPAAARPRLWDVCLLPQLRPMLDDLPGYSAAPWIGRFFDTYEAVTTPAWRRLRRQVLHNDMNLKNVLVDPDEPSRIVGLIDFGDVSEAALAADLAVAASTQLLHGSSSVQADIMDTVDAYRSWLPLQDEELAILPWLIAGRLVSGLLIPAWHRAKNPASRHFPAKSEAAIAERIALADTVTRLRLS
jgi:Ser/Thr protein kinase RdoA (MazF antagonist)